MKYKIYRDGDRCGVLLFGSIWWCEGDTYEGNLRTAYWLLKRMEDKGLDAQSRKRFKQNY